MSLPDDEVHIFKVYEAWLNSKELRYNFDEEECWLHLAKLWIFADKICSFQLKNKVTDAFYDVVSQNKDLSFAKPDVVHFIYEHTSPNSSLRSIICYLFYFTECCRATYILYPQEFLAWTLRTAMKTLNSKRSKTPRGSEKYHEKCLEPCCKESMQSE